MMNIIPINNSEYYFESNVIPASFPTQVDMNEMDAFSMQSFQERFELSWKKRIPDYLIGISEVQYHNKTTYYLYEGAFLFYYFNSNPTSLDLTTNLPIKKVYFFAIDCFTSKNKQNPVLTNANSCMFQPHFISNSTFFDQYVLEKHNMKNFEQFQKWIFNGINPNWEEKKFLTADCTQREKIIAQVACVLTAASQKNPYLKNAACRWFNCAKNAFGNVR